MELEKFVREIQSTGFPLEHEIATVLRSSGWSVTTSKYYVDDLQDTVREIDLVAHRSQKLPHFELYTTLIISCKKSEHDAWVLLSREVDDEGPNSDGEPFHGWSNTQHLQHLISRPTWATNYYSRARALGVERILDAPTQEIFAFQEMDQKTGRPHNDKAIFSAITSLMKAQAYEIGSLPRRGKTPTFNQINLISVVDADLVRLDFRRSPAAIIPMSIEDELFVAQYIVHKQEMSARIHFVTSRQFPEALRYYDELHRANCRILAEADDAFFTGIFEDYFRWRLLLDEFHSRTKLWVWAALYPSGTARPLTALPPPSFRLGNDRLVLEYRLNSEELAALNDDETTTDHVRVVLRAVYRYDGPIRFSHPLVVRGQGQSS